MPRAARKRGVFIGDLKLDLPIYRYMRVKDLKQTLKSSKFFLSNVGAWTDPYERWWCEELFHPGSKLAGVHAYGSCWSLHSSDEPFWRLYQDRCLGHSAHLPPVRVQAKPESLLAMMSRAVAAVEAKVYLGDVRYRERTDVEATAAAFRATQREVASTAASGLHLKRKAFEYEREIRLLWIDRAARRDSILIDFNPLEVFEEIMVGPSSDLATFETLQAEFVDLGFPPDRIVRSLIYQPPAAV